MVLFVNLHSYRIPYNLYLTLSLLNLITEKSMFRKNTKSTLFVLLSRMPIKSIKARQIFDSRGNPTVEVDLVCIV